MEQVTVKKLLTEVGVHPEKLNERISDDHLCEIALFLTEWKTVVPFLGLDENDVDAIEQEEKKEQVKKLKALRKWKRKFAFAATYRKLVEVLLSLGMADVAEKVCHLLKAPQTTKQTPVGNQKYLRTSQSISGVIVHPRPSSPTQSKVPQTPLEAGSPTPISIVRSFPYKKVSRLTPEQQERLKIRLCVESEDIVRKFGHLQSRVYESLCERNVSVDKLVTHLLTLGAFDPVHKGSQKPVFQAFSKELWNARSIEEVLYIIRSCISFFNYHIIEHIVNELGTEQDRVELQKYEKEFDEYSKRRVYECPPDYWSETEASHVDLVLKVDSVYEEFTVKELKMFECRLSRILNVSPQSVLLLCRVEEGCLQLIFQVPSFVQQEIFPLSSEQEIALAAEGVIRLTCEDYQFTTKGNSIHEAARQGGLDTVRHLIDEGTDANIKDDDGGNVLHGTTDGGHVDKGAKTSDKENSVGNSIHKAARQGDLDTVRCLIDEGTDVNIKDNDGITPLHVAAERGHPRIVEYLVDKGADIDIQDKNGQTPSHLAAEKGRFENTLKYLVDKQADINVKDNDGRTPLHVAVKEFRVKTAEFLVDNKADINSQDNDGMTPLHVAAKKGESLEIVKYLICKGADINIQNNNTQTPLHTAAEDGNEFTMKELVKLGADINIKDKDGRTPLDVAVVNGYDVIEEHFRSEKMYPTSMDKTAKEKASSKKGGALSEQAELKLKIMSLEDENEKLRRQLDQYKSKSTREGREQKAAKESLIEETQVELTIGDLVDVTDYLLELGDVDIYNLGLTLGLNQPHLQDLERSDTFRDKMIAAWLHKEDQVAKRGMPTWKTLVKALRHPRLGKTVIADKIAKEKSIGDLVDVTDYLLELGDVDLHNLGLILGLNQPRLQNLKSSKTFRDDMITAWLHKEDQVAKRGMPTWETLVKALRHPRLGKTVIADKIAKEKSIGDLVDVTDYLLELGDVDIYNLGLILGLNQPRLQNLLSSKNFRDDMIAAWLRNQDQVTKRGMPTWETLVKALRHPRLGKTVIADKIAKEKCSKKGGALSEQAELKLKMSLEDENEKLRRQLDQDKSKSTGEGGEQKAAKESQKEETQVELTIGDLVDVTDYLLELGDVDIYNLGLILGLNQPRLQNLKSSKTFRDDMIAAWLHKEDQVAKRGVPTWETLVKALRHPRLCKTVFADKIAKEKSGHSCKEKDQQIPSKHVETVLTEQVQVTEQQQGPPITAASSGKEKDKQTPTKNVETVSKHVQWVAQQHDCLAGSGKEKDKQIPRKYVETVTVSEGVAQQQDEVNFLSSAVNKAKQVGVQFIDPVEIISCDTHGCEYYNPKHDVGFKIPEGAIPLTEGIVDIEFGVAMYGPFKLSDGRSIRRVSPVVWLCVPQDGFSGFQKDVEISIPHFLQLSTEDAHKYLRFLKADHELDVLSEDGKIQYQLKPAAGTAVFDHDSDATHGKLFTRHFCSVCIATSVFHNEHTRYCLGGELRLTAQGRQIIFYVCYLLKSCVETVEQQLDKGSERIYKIHPTEFMFTDGKKLKINHNELPGWILATESSKKILANNVDFQQMNKDELILKEHMNLYPPRFVVRIGESSSAEDSKAVFTFEGATEKIVKEVILTKVAGYNRTRLISMVVLVLLGAVMGIRLLLPSPAVDCGTLPDPANGRVSHTTGTTVGQTATYSCNLGYNLVGDRTRTCQATGVWSGSSPTCQSPEGCTSISKLQELEKAVAEIGDWEALCENLGVDRAILSDLRHMINTKNTEKKRRCLQAYIDTDKACWEQVVKVVADHPFNNARIANKIAHDYLHGVGYAKDEL